MLKTIIMAETFPWYFRIRSEFPRLIPKNPKHINHIHDAVMQPVIKKTLGKPEKIVEDEPIVKKASINAYGFSHEIARVEPTMRRMGNVFGSSKLCSFGILYHDRMARNDKNKMPPRKIPAFNSGILKITSDIPPTASAMRTVSAKEATSTTVMTLTIRPRFIPWLKTNRFCGPKGRMSPNPSNIP